MCLDYTSLLPLLLFAFKFLWERLRGLFVAAPAGACAGGACALPGAGGGAPAAAVEGKEVEVAYVRSIEEWRELLQSAQADGVAVVVDFTATWCGPCQRIAPVFAKLAEEMPDIVFVKVDVDENEETAGACGIQAMPTFQFYKTGAKAHEFSGASEEKIKEAIAKFK